MSTKIYTAWRVRVWRLNSFLKIFSDHCNERIDVKVKQLISAVDKSDEELLEGYKYDEDNVEKWKELWKQASRLKTVMNQCKRAAVQMERDLLFDIESGCQVYIRGLYAYIIPWGEEYFYTGIEQAPEFPRWIEDYSYWNNTDRPDDFSSRRWRKRGDHWNKILDGPRLIYHSMEVPKYHGHYCPTYYDLERRIINNTKIELALIDMGEVMKK